MNDVTAEATQKAKTPTPPPKAKAPPASKGRAYVIVCSKLPHDLELQCQELREREVPGRYGTQTEKAYQVAGDVHYIRGTSYPSGGQIPAGYPDKPQMADGYALTYKIPADFWARWSEQNKDTLLIKNRIIFARDDVDSVYDNAADNRDVNSGLGPLVENDRRNPKPISGFVAKIQPDYESMTGRPQSTPRPRPEQQEDEAA
jgi:hypothetical protein